MMKDNISKRELHFEIEDAYKSLELVNGWINNLDTKASFLLAYLAVVLGFVVSNGRPNLFTQPVPSPMVFGFVIKVICVIALFLSLALSIVLFLSTLTARIKGKEKQHSLFFFGEIASNSLNDYKAKILNRTEEDLIKDVLEQVHTNSIICMTKSKCYNAGVKLSLISTGLYVVCMFWNLL